MIAHGRLRKPPCQLDVDEGHQRVHEHLDEQLLHEARVGVKKRREVGDTCVGESFGLEGAKRAEAAALRSPDG
jgi:hypothetical protein